MELAHNNLVNEIAIKLRDPLRLLKARARILENAARVRQGEAKVLAFHIRQQADVREQRRSPANLLFAFGAIVEREGYLDLDDYAVAGIEHHGQLYALWIAQAAVETLASSRGELLRHVFADPRRLDWCRKEGARLAWEHAKAAREAESALFHKRREGKTQHWRKGPMTARQHYMMTLISVRGAIPMPGNLRCGPAHDWISINGAHPNFWVAPARPPPWRLD